MKRLIYVSSLLILGAFVVNCSNIEEARRLNPITPDLLHANLNDNKEGLNCMGPQGLSTYLNSLESEFRKMSLKRD